MSKNILACKPRDFIDHIDGIAHLAANPSVTESWLNPLGIHCNNLSTTVAVIQLCQNLNISKIVLASSAAIYGSQSERLMIENLVPYPISPYGLQKLASEQYANLFAQRLSFSFVALRIFNAFGPRQKLGNHYSGVVASFASAMRQNLPITIYGDGSQTRDFIYVNDVAIAFGKALTTPLPSGKVLICNVATGKSISITQLVEILKTHFPDWQPKVDFAPPRLEDILHSQADTSRASSFLGFTAQWSVETGISSLVEL